MFYEGMKFVFFDFETTGVDARGLIDDDLPIELGMILTDDKLFIEDIFQVYIYWDVFGGLEDWPEKYKPAYNIHKIDFDTLHEYGYPPEDVIRMIFNNFLPKDMKPTLVSDNAYFDTLMMHKLFNTSSFDFFDCFHYTTWDINMLYVPLGTKKLVEHTHSAFEDASNMYHRTFRSLMKINYFDNL